MAAVEDHTSEMRGEVSFRRGDVLLVTADIGGGWLDITIDSYSIQPPDDAQAKRDELGAFIRTLASLQVGISSICPMEMG